MRAALLIVCLVAVGCTGEPVKSTPRKSLADRRADAQATLSKTPTPRTYRIDGTGLINSHASETTGDAFNPERTIFNDRGLPELRTETLRNLWEATSGLQITILGNLTDGDA